MPFDMDRETREKFSEDDDERAPNFLWWVGAMVFGLGLWGVILWLVGAL